MAERVDVYPVEEPSGSVGAERIGGRRHGSRGIVRGDQVADAYILVHVGREGDAFHDSQAERSALVEVEGRLGQGIAQTRKRRQLFRDPPRDRGPPGEGVGRRDYEPAEEQLDLAGPMAPPNRPPAETVLRWAGAPGKRRRGGVRCLFRSAPAELRLSGSPIEGRPTSAAPNCLLLKMRRLDRTSPRPIVHTPCP